MRVHAHQGDTLDALLWRHTGRTAALVEATLLANPGLADLGDGVGCILHVSPRA